MALTVLPTIGWVTAPGLTAPQNCREREPITVCVENRNRHNGLDEKRSVLSGFSKDEFPDPPSHSDMIKCLFSEGQITGEP